MLPDRCCSQLGTCLCRRFRIVVQHRFSNVCGWTPRCSTRGPEYLSFYHLDPGSIFPKRLPRTHHRSLPSVASPAVACSIAVAVGSYNNYYTQKNGHKTNEAHMNPNAHSVCPGGRSEIKLGALSKGRNRTIAVMTAAEARSACVLWWWWWWWLIKSGRLVISGIAATQARGGCQISFSWKAGNGDGNVLTESLVVSAYCRFVAHVTWAAPSEARSSLCVSFPYPL